MTYWVQRGGDQGRFGKAEGLFQQQYGPGLEDCGCAVTGLGARQSVCGDLVLCTGALISPQVPLPSHTGPQLTLGELAHITLVAEDVFDALLRIHDRTHTADAGELQQGI